MTVSLISGEIADTAVGASDQVRVTTPNLNYLGRRTHGPIGFRPQISAEGGVRLPVRGDRALLAVDTEGEAWLVEWSRADLSALTSHNLADIAVIKEAPLNAQAAEFGAIGQGTVDTAALQAFLTAVANPNTGKGHGIIPTGHYLHGDLLIPSSLGNAGGGSITGVGPWLTKLEYTGSGYGITIGDGGTYATSRQSLKGLEIIGNANADGAVQFNKAQWCEIAENYIHGFTQSGAEAVLLRADGNNYWNNVLDNWFATNYRHVVLEGDPTGIGANSNIVQRNTFSIASGDAQLVIDGGDTNRILDNEFDGAQAVALKMLGVSIYNTVGRNQFDGPTKAWDIASACSFNQFLDNTGAMAILNASTDGGVNNIRRDVYTQQSYASAYLSSAQSVANGDFPFAVLSWTGEEYDPLGMHDISSNQDRLTVLIPGLYRVSCVVHWAAHATGVRMARIVKNAAADILAEDERIGMADGTSPTFNRIDFDHVFAAGDYIRCQVYQLSGGALDAAGGLTSPGSRLQMRRVA